MVSVSGEAGWPKFEVLAKFAHAIGQPASCMDPAQSRLLEVVRCPESGVPGYLHNSMFLCKSDNRYCRHVGLPPSVFNPLAVK